MNRNITRQAGTATVVLLLIFPSVLLPVVMKTGQPGYGMTAVGTDAGDDGQNVKVT